MQVKSELAEQTNLTITQIHDWFANKRKKKDNKTSPKQAKLKLLRDYFISNQHPNKENIIELATRTDTSEKKLSSWFAKERSKLKKNREKNQITANKEYSD